MIAVSSIFALSILTATVLEFSVTFTSLIITSPLSSLLTTVYACAFAPLVNE